MTWDFQQFGILTSLETPNDSQSVAYESYNIQVTCLDSDQTVPLHKLVWGFVGRTYHIVGNLKSLAKILMLMTMSND